MVKELLALFGTMMRKLVIISTKFSHDRSFVIVKNVLTLSHQLKYFAHYKRHLSMNIGAKKAAESIHNAVFVLSMGTNDFLQNYYVEPTRSSQYTVDQYGDYLVSLFQGYIKVVLLTFIKS